MRKSQADIISVILIIIVALGLSSTAYFWGLPLIQKNQDTTKVERVDKYFDRNNVNSLPKKIEQIANNGGEDVFNMDVDGLWILNETGDYIEFTFNSKSTKVSEGIGWLPEGSCKESVDLLGSDAPSVTCKKAEKSATDFKITYRLLFKELSEDPSDPNSRSYKIFLLKHPYGTMTSISKTLRISRGEIKPNPDRQNLIMTEIKILLGY